MPIDTFSYENLADGEMEIRRHIFVVGFFVRFDEKNPNQKLEIDKPETEVPIDTFSYENLADGEL